MIFPHDLQRQYTVDPVGIDASQPRFSWLLRADERGQRQSAYQVLVASSEAKLLAAVGDKWDSGRVVSTRAAGIDAGAKNAGAENGDAITFRVGSGSYDFRLAGV